MLLILIISILVLVGCLYLLFFIWELLDDYADRYCEFFWIYPTKIILVIAYIVLIGTVIYLNAGGQSLC